MIRETVGKGQLTGTARARRFSIIRRMIPNLTYLYRFNLQFAERLVKDLSAEQMVQQPGGVVNHPAWSIGHLAVSANGLGQFLGLESTVSDDWASPFKTGGVPSATLADYPSKAELIEALTTQHARVTEAIQRFDVTRFGEPHPNEGTRKYFPTMGDLVVFLMTGHEMDHLGQVAAWRRAMGLGAA